MEVYCIEDFFPIFEQGTFIMDGKELVKSQLLSDIFVRSCARTLNDEETVAQRKRWGELLLERWEVVKESKPSAQLFLTAALSGKALDRFDEMEAKKVSEDNDAYIRRIIKAFESPAESECMSELQFFESLAARKMRIGDSIDQTLSDLRKDLDKVSSIQDEEQKQRLLMQCFEKVLPDSISRLLQATESSDMNDLVKRAKKLMQSSTSTEVAMSMKEERNGKMLEEVVRMQTTQYESVMKEIQKLKDDVKVREKQMVMNVESRCGFCGGKNHVEENCWQKDPSRRPARRGNFRRGGGDGHFQDNARMNRPSSQGQHDPQVSVCQLCGAEGHKAPECNKRRPVHCHLCGQEGHIARWCERGRSFARGRGRGYYQQGYGRGNHYNNFNGYQQWGWNNPQQYGPSGCDGRCSNNYGANSQSNGSLNR